MKYLLAILSLFSFGFAQNSQDLIYWSENSKLEWKDFKGQPDQQNPHLAMTYGSFRSSGRSSRDTLIIGIESVFSQVRSWVKTNGRTQSTLNHEQLHFDILEVYSRKLKKTIREAQIKRETARADIDKLTKEVWEQLDIYQNLYDSETNHSRIIAKQKEWESKIPIELKALSAYKDASVKIIPPK